MGQVSVTLSGDEWTVISGLRDLPESPLREMTYEMMLALVEYVREPKCAEMQADGVPCTSAEADCEQCAKVRELLHTLRRGLASPPRQPMSPEA
ncbi:MAG TPA: hypothetical protein PLB88_08225 [Thermoanaerobaculaceae bacterium]|nr:MAG: hypothetical protein B7Z61_12985 [Acidobacteria bacterium 37-71-11]HQT93930.1 hypothetical protein [Thermoanaerobaculaceae bacterium]HQU34287.1 hypothetical protein [Thermoanaerobaculaceae bacterium]